MRNRQKSYLWGHAAEYLCCLLLLLKGYRILRRRCKTPLGEIDIVAAKARQIIFVEVKARGDLTSGLEANTGFQQSRIMHAASYYMNHPAHAQKSARFDMMVARPWRLPYHLIDAWRP